MPHRIPWNVTTQNHPGSAAEDIDRETHWSGGHQHRIGFKNRDDRQPGITHHDDEHPEATQTQTNGISRTTNGKSASIGKLVDFRDIVSKDRDRDASNPEERPTGWRDVFDYTEEWIKNTERWPANVKREQQQAQKDEEAKDSKSQTADNQFTGTNGVESGQDGEEAE